MFIIAHFRQQSILIFKLIFIHLEQPVICVEIYFHTYKKYHIAIKPYKTKAYRSCCMTFHIKIKIKNKKKELRIYYV